jgi:anti-sigma regulatory factor (Ser/Thr protein kinase)
MRSVRARILLLVLIPVLSLVGLYLLTTGITGKSALNLARAQALKTATREPVSNFLGQLDTERVFALTYLSAPTPRKLATLRAQESATGHATVALRAALTSGSTLSNAPPAVRQASTTLLRDTAGLPRLHSSITSRAVTRPQALAVYNKVIGDSYLLLHQVVLTETSAPIVAQALTVERIATSGELLQQENALLVADMAARRFPRADQHAFTRLTGARTTLYDQTLPELEPGYRAIYQSDVSPGAYAALTALENRIIGSRRSPLPPPVAPGHWERAVQGVSSGLERAGTQAATALDVQARHQARITDLRLLLLGGIGLLTVVASIVVSLLVGRGLVRELSDLRRSAEDLAGDRLPRMVDQLAAGGNLDVAEEPPDIKVKTREIGQVRDALAKVQRTAVDAAVGQARLRAGIGEVFRDLARRSQSLLHRQLALLDRMERRTEDPRELEDLFRIEHLTTRMRRHAESLIVLSGQAPARGWRNPVPFVDVIRAAVAEVEDYTRVSVISAGDIGLAGPAVGDVIHMLAELVENATIYSPPNTPVVIQGGIVGQGFVVEIEDRGLGMSDDKLAEANANLADPLPFDPAGTDQLGLLVAGQLAKRHAIQITLRRNPYGGTTAIVLIPHRIVVAEGFELEPAKALEGAPPMLDQHPAKEQHGPASEADTEPDLAYHRGPGEAAAGSPLPAYQAAPLTAPPPRAEAYDPPPAETDRPPPAETDMPPPAKAGPLPSVDGDTPDQAEAELRAWTGMESPAWRDPPHPAAGPSAWDGRNPPMLPRRVRPASLAPQLRDASPAYSSLPGRLPAPGPPEEMTATGSAIQPGAEQERSMSGPATGLPQEPGATGRDGTDSGDAAGEEGGQ